MCCFKPSEARAARHQHGAARLLASQSHGTTGANVIVRDATLEKEYDTFSKGAARCCCACLVSLAAVCLRRELSTSILKCCLGLTSFFAVLNCLGNAGGVPGRLGLHLDICKGVVGLSKSV